MTQESSILTVYYDGGCPRCVRERQRYSQLAGRRADQVRWVDITGRESRLREHGIDPDLALRELHVEDESGHIHREMDAYILLMGRTLWLRPLAWLIGLPGIRPLVSRWYHWWVTRRLRRTGRLPETTPDDGKERSDR